MKPRIGILGLLVLPFLVLTASYIILCVEYGRVNIFNEIVHENSRYTLLQTIFYFEHFTREIVISVFTAFAAACAFYLMAPLDFFKEAGSARRFLKMGTFIILFFLASTSLAALLKSGAKTLWLDLLQFRTRDDLVSYGSHWHSHFLHVLQIFAASLGISLVFRAVTALPGVRPNPYGAALLWGWAVIFIFLSVFFSTGTSPFTDPRYLAHAFREIVTHTAVTLPLTFAALIAVEDRLITAPRVGLKNEALFSKGILVLSLSFFVPIFILFQLGGMDILPLAQKQSGILDLFASHFFEHTLDYFFVPLLASLLYAAFLLCGRMKTS